jgi:hypothetical protein
VDSTVGTRFPQVDSTVGTRFPQDPSAAVADR